MADKPTKKYRILSLDGGGIRGLMSAIWLEALEREIGRPLRECFDLVAGTSTGSILAAAVAIGLPAGTVVDLYLKRGREVFPAAGSRRWSRVLRTFNQGVSAPKYDDSGLARVLKDVLGTMPLEKLDKPHLLITTYNVLTREALVFKTVRRGGKIRYGALPVWEVVKASCAAPTYFPAHVTKLDQADAPLIDGGVVANNPTACAIAEGVRINQEPGEGVDPCELKDFVVASFGTGQMTRPISLDESREWGAVEWAIPVIDVLFDGAADAADYIAQYLVPEKQYFRFQTALHEAYDDMDNADSTNLNALVNVAQSYLAGEGQAKIVQLARQLQLGPDPKTSGNAPPRQDKPPQRRRRRQSGG